MRRRRLCRFATPSDKIVETSSRDTCGFPELDRLDLTSCYQFIELSATNPNHSGSVVDANTYRIMRYWWRGHRAELLTSSSR